MAGAGFEHELHNRNGRRLGFRQRHPMCPGTTTVTARPTWPSSGRPPAGGGFFGPAAATRRTSRIAWGINTDIPMPSDYDADGRPTRPSIGPAPERSTPLFRSNYTTAGAVSWGITTDRPDVGDYDGDGKPTWLFTLLLTPRSMAGIAPGRSCFLDPTTRPRCR